jgi:hypothetical protein
MKPDMSEFSYGYALTESMVATAPSGVSAAPLFPSLQEEGATGGGYDVQIPFVNAIIFLQFKLSDCMIRSSAFECKEHHLEAPFYRMHLRSRRHSQQHDLLLDLVLLGRWV